MRAKYTIGAACALLVAALTLRADADAGSYWDIDDARACVKLEIAVDKAGRYREIEYHIEPSEVPEAVRAAMDKLHPGGPFTAAERERNDGVLYFELSREVNGYEVEAMFTPEGKLHSEELTVPAERVPESVRSAIGRALPQGKVTGYEEIRDGDRELNEYHVKVQQGSRHWKIMVTPAGAITESVLEVPAEIEVPTPLPR